MTDINWTTLYESLQVDLESDQWMTKSYQIGSRRREFRDISELLEFMQFVETKASLQANTISGRTYARPVRRH